MVVLPNVTVLSVMESPTQTAASVCGPHPPTLQILSFRGAANQKTSLLKGSRERA